MRDPTNNVPFPPCDNYYLCDVAYANTRGFTALYRNTRYWLSDYRNDRHPRKKEEMFNHAHARLRNVIERAFAVLKARFRILKKMAPHPYPVVRNIFIACVATHNYLRKTSVSDAIFDRFDEDHVNMPIKCL
ncbi:hypothetical protein M5689_020758 [Euphorbia peplus]|nr:hypothetical protein M5689_020758 [Euphorbia peplus]